jgi:hypothetical protein
MRSLRQLCVTAVLTIALVVSAHAGEIECPGITQTPPPQETVTGEIECPGVTQVIVIFVESLLLLP